MLTNATMGTVLLHLHYIHCDGDRLYVFGQQAVNIVEVQMFFSIMECDFFWGGERLYCS